MARKTKAQMQAEALAEQQMLDAEFEQHRYKRLMEATALAFHYNAVSLKGGWGEAQVSVEQKEDADGLKFFAVRASASHAYAREMNTFHANFNDRMSRQEFEDSMFRLNSEVSYMEAYVAEQEAKRLARNAALAKLSPEERTLLGV